MELKISNLSKTYANGVKALDNVSLTVPTGMFGLLGPNGAGKSSLMRTIATLQLPDTGTVMLGEIDVLRNKMEARALLGYLPQEFGVYSRVSGEDLLHHLAVLKGITNKGERKALVDSLLQKTNLYDHRKKYVDSYSGGMRQRFGIAQALIGNPKLIIVDEPTAGLDPGERNRFLNLLSEIGENTIVILSTHIVEDVRELCTSMAIINQGKVLLHGHPEEAVQKLQGRIWSKRVTRETVSAYKERFSVISERMIGGRPEIHVYSETQPEQGFESKLADLEDVFFAKLSALA